MARIYEILIKYLPAEILLFVIRQIVATCNCSTNYTADIFLNVLFYILEGSQRNGVLSKIFAAANLNNPCLWILLSLAIIQSEAPSLAQHL